MEIASQSHLAPARDRFCRPEWKTIHPEGFAAVHWTFTKYPNLVCNGVKICRLNKMDDKCLVGWPIELGLKCPSIAVDDNNAMLPLTVQRERLTNDFCSFVFELAEDVILSFIAHALVVSPHSRADLFKFNERHPLNKDRVTRLPPAFSCFGNNKHFWCASNYFMVPYDLYLYSLLGTKSLIVWGGARSRKQEKTRYVPSNIMAFPDTSSMMNVDLFNDFLHGSHSLNREWEEILLNLNNDVKICEEIGGVCNFMASVNLPIRVKSSGSGENRLLKDIHDVDSADLEWQRMVCNRNENSNTSVIGEILFEMESFFAGEYVKGKGVICYVAEFEFPDTSSIIEPETTLAKIWNKYLGPNPIPFDKEKRQAMIDKAKREHPDLGRHIDAWEVMNSPEYKAEQERKKNSN